MSNLINSPNPCTDKLTDLEYLEHMIPIKVAVDMSKLLEPNINNPTMLHLCRNIIENKI